MTVELHDYSAAWPAAYRRTAANVRAALGERPRIEHIGSTAIPGLSAKPVIDILIGFDGASALEVARTQLMEAGWTAGSPGGSVSAFVRRPARTDEFEINAHLAVVHDRAWTDLLGFRDWLRMHPDQAKAYELLKRDLSATWRDDVDAYTGHKTPFVCNVLDGMDVVNGTLRQQRDALSKAVVLRCVSIALQLSISVCAIVSVLFSSDDPLVFLAGLTILLVVGWISSDGACRKQRSDGEQARRLIQIEYGLGQRVSERSLITEPFPTPRAGLRINDILGNFATRAPPGMQRLADMIDESAFFSGAVQKWSGAATTAALAIAAATVFLFFLFIGPKADDGLLAASIRMFMAFAVFLLSADVVGAAIAHFKAGAVMDAVRLRISSARGRGCPDGDVLQAMIDYNAALSDAPPPLPFAYELINGGLASKWTAHKAAVYIGV